MTEVIKMRMKMNTTATTNQRQARRMDADREELAERLARALPRDGVAESRAGLYISRFGRPHDLVHGFLDPCMSERGKCHVRVSSPWRRGP
jgi:hypothetical protein